MSRLYQYAGLQQVQQPGLSVDSCAARLHHLAYAEERLMFLQAAHLVSTPERDVKVLLSRLQYEDSQHADQLKARLPELRVSKKKAYKEPAAWLKVVLMGQLIPAAPPNCWPPWPWLKRPCWPPTGITWPKPTTWPIIRPFGMLQQIVAEEEEALPVGEAAYRDVVVTAEQQAAAGRGPRPPLDAGRRRR
ncbi:MAG: hypothetical protein U0401_21435 [Anaerolineae bacterium]